MYYQHLEKGSLAEILKHNNGVEELLLGHNYLEDDDVRAICALKNIRKVNMMSCPISDLSAQMFARNKTIHDLYLGSCWKIGDKGAKALAKSTNIQKLHLHNTNIGNEGIKALAKNNTIRELYIRGTNIDDESMKVFLCNKTILLLDYREEDISRGLHDAIKKRLIENIELFKIEGKKAEEDFKNSNCEYFKDILGIIYQYIKDDYELCVNVFVVSHKEIYVERGLCTF
jgi:peroxiredoxin family protein